MKNTKENQLKLKHFSTFCLASFIALLTLFGTACTPTQSNTNQNTSTTTTTVQSAPSALGLDPENDPIIYTTESGLEIKYGGIDLNASLASGALQGYPYFTMGTYSNKPVNWVIIGRNSNVTTFNNPFSAKLFSSWLSTNNVFAQYFKNNFYETSTPAGSAINSSTASNGFIQDTAGAVSLSSVKDNDSEIPSGCVLAISEYCLGSSTYGSTVNYNASNIRSYINTLYTSTLNIPENQKALLQPQTISSRWSNTSDSTANQYLFTLSALYSEFQMGNYLTENSLRIAYNIGTTTAVEYWLRDGSIESGIKDAAFFVQTSGNITGNYRDGSYSTNTKYARPACVISLQ